MVGVDGQLGQRVGQLAPRRCGWGGGATRHTPRAPTVSLPITLCCVLSLRMHVHQDVFLHHCRFSIVAHLFGVGVCGRGAGEQIWLQSRRELGEPKTWITRIPGLRVLLGSKL